MTNLNGVSGSSPITERIVASQVEYEGDVVVRFYAKFLLDLKSMPRPRVSPRRNVYLPREYKQHLQLLESLIRHVSGGGDWHGGYRVEITVRKPHSVFSPRYGDVDNLLKTVMDALPFNDAFVLDARSSKHVDDEFSVEIVAERVVK